MTTGQRLPNVLEAPLDGDPYDNLGNDSSSVDETRTLLPKPSNKPSFYVPARFVLAACSCLGFVSTFSLRMDLNLAILDMVKSGNDNLTVRSTNNSNQSPKFQWSENQQYILLSAFYYGYCSTQILGGYLSGRVGGKLVFGLASVVSSLLGLVTPFAAFQSYGLLIACRIGQGLAQGLAQPCMHTIWSNWAPENERSILMTITYAGCQLGNVIATLASGYLCSLEILGGWPSVFYIYGSAGVVWSALWFFLVYDAPSEHPRISQRERDYIEQSINRDPDKKRTKTAWTKVLTSPALIAIIAAQFANDWGAIALTTCLPKYLKSILKYDLELNGFLSSLPFMVILVINPASGFLADSLRARRILSTKNTRKLMNSIGLFIPSGLMLAVVFCDHSRVAVVALCTLAVGVSGFTMAGYSVNHLDIAPTIVGILYGITNTIGTTVGFIGPVILGVLTGDKKDTEHQWHIFFYITSAIFFAGGLIFLLFAQGEPQNWSLPDTDSSKKETDYMKEKQPNHLLDNNVHCIQHDD